MADENGNIVIKKRCKKTKCKEENSAWEIAYGDFMTSMMAFFLIMWLIAATNVRVRKVIAYYFTHPGAINISHKGSSGMPSTGVFNIGSKTLPITPIPARPKVPSVNAIKPEAGVTNNTNNKISPIGEREYQKLTSIMLGLEREINTNKGLSRYKNQIQIRMTPKGLEITIFDRNKRPMFANGSAELEPYAKKILAVIAKKLVGIPNPIVISGYTDATKYMNSRFSNWDLSTMRANAARQELQRDGIPSSRFYSVVGYGDTHPIPGTSPYDPINRRIVILVKKL